MVTGESPVRGFDFLCLHETPAQGCPSVPLEPPGLLTTRGLFLTGLDFGTWVWYTCGMEDKKESATKFTPGPWEALGLTVEAKDSGLHVCQALLDHDARLIAAAPALFEALEAVLQAPLAPVVMAMARAALAQARGEKPSTEYPLGARVTFRDGGNVVSGEEALCAGTVNGPQDHEYVPVWAERDNGREATTIMVHTSNIMEVAS